MVVAVRNSPYICRVHLSLVRLRRYARVLAFKPKHDAGIVTWDQSFPTMHTLSLLCFYICLESSVAVGCVLSAFAEFSGVGVVLSSTGTVEGTLFIVPMA